MGIDIGKEFLGKKVRKALINLKRLKLP